MNGKYGFSLLPRVGRDKSPVPDSIPYFLKILIASTFLKPEICGVIIDLPDHHSLS